MTRVLIPLVGDDVAPRFDVAPEALIAEITAEGGLIVEKSIVLPQASAEALCRLIMTERIDIVACCAIEEEYYQYLTWKKIKVVDSLMGNHTEILEQLRKEMISNG